MDQVTNERATAQELLSVAQQKGIDLQSIYKDFVFQKGPRWIFVWRKLDPVPASGRADETEGTLRYNMQGSIAVLPKALKRSASAFQGAWRETGAFESLEQAVDFLKAWLLDGKEVDDLPSRCVRSYGI